MLIHPWDAAVDSGEWQQWLDSTDRFGVLAVNNSDPLQAPIVVPTHFTVAGDDVLIHLARPNPVWAHLEVAGEVRLVVTGDYAFIPGYWRSKDGDPTEKGVPTSYYATVGFVCRPTIVDDPAAKAAILDAQLADFQPEGGHVSVAEEPYARMLAGIRGLRLVVVRVEAKFKYDDNRPVAQREKIIDELGSRGRGLDDAVAAQQQRRVNEIGDWNSGRGRA
ncbi:FMN-binding negative transcriptional regulator [Gordonia sp. LSe1-13]|uniref:FMN-binding negative transcriptional regulator n=1 Tax=Gordonia sesuvii TaxID=3116777 RepID=A0ABU7M9G5_9ACTN|nr:FMN-binding negative transcriptional regulator [Gordonia sp. LSe1-13]